MNAPAAGHSAPAVTFDNVTKRFGATLANHEITFGVPRGSIHAIVGENGAGKSTLMHLLYGVHRPDTGRILIDGVPVTLHRPRDAIAAGIGMIHQHLSLVPTLTVLENVILGREPRRLGRIHAATAHARVADLAAVHGLRVELTVPVGELDIGAQQRVEILKALYRGARVLLLDEPTTVLAPEEYARFAESLRRFAAAGGTILYVSHRLPEVFDLCDRVTVLRAGRVVATEETGSLNATWLARLMVGEAQAPEAASQTPGPVRPGVPTSKVIELDAVSTLARPGDAGLHKVSLTVRRGEILGVAGVAGNGQRALAGILAGTIEPGRGRVLWHGEHLWNHRGLRARRRAGVGWIPADRTTAGVVGGLSVADNLVLGRHERPPFARLGVRSRGAVREAADTPIKELRVQPPDPDGLAGPLSGGNQQKLLVARELAGSPQLLIAEHPTRGLDIATRLIVHSKLIALRDRGAGVVFFGADLEELLAVADRIVVMYAGRILKSVPARGTTAAELGPLLGGITEDVTHAAGAATGD